MIRAAIAIVIVLTPGMAWAGSNGLFDGVGSAGGATTYIRPDGSGGYIATQPQGSIINGSGYETVPFGRNQLRDSVLGFKCRSNPSDPACY
jgi:hypothetical protein